jgi:outer membrane protein assembly factor BamB
MRMKIRPADAIVPGLLAAVGVVLLVFWLGTGSHDDLRIRSPGMDRLTDADGPQARPLTPVVAGDPVRSSGVPADLPGQWPCFRGADRDGICRDRTPLARAWPPEGPSVLWSVGMGEGYASPVIGHGCAYVLDYDERAKADTMRCLSLNDGQEIWRNSYPVLVTRNHGMSRTVAALVGDCVISLGPRCHVACWDVKTGNCLWIVDLVTQYGATVPRWYAGQCPLVDQDRLILAPGGEAMLIALEVATGRLVWQSPNPRGWQMTHTTIVPMDLKDRRTYVYCGTGGVAGIAAADGALLWDSTEWPEKFATSPSPVILPGGRIFLSSGYGNKTGSLMLKLREEPERILVETVFRLAPKQFNSEQQTPIFFAGHLYGVRKRGGGQLVCLDLSGNELWNSGADRFGHGPYLIADGLIFVMDNRGQLTMAEATPTEYKRLARCNVFEDGHDAWGPMALVAGRLIVRDMTRMACLDVAAPPDDVAGSDKPSNPPPSP